MNEDYWESHLIFQVAIVYLTQVSSIREVVPVVPRMTSTQTRDIYFTIVLVALYYDILTSQFSMLINLTIEYKLNLERTCTTNLIVDETCIVSLYVPMTIIYFSPRLIKLVGFCDRARLATFRTDRNHKILLCFNTLKAKIYKPIFSHSWRRERKVIAYVITGVIREKT